MLDIEDLMLEGYGKSSRKQIVFKNEIFLGTYFNDLRKNILHGSVLRKDDKSVVCPRLYHISRGVLRCPPGEYVLRPHGVNNRPYRGLFVGLTIMYRQRELHTLEISPRLEVKDEDGKICLVSPHFAVRRFPGDDVVYVRSSEKESKASFYKRRLLFAYTGKNVIKIFAGRERETLEDYDNPARFID